MRLLETLRFETCRRCFDEMADVEVVARHLRRASTTIYNRHLPLFLCALLRRVLIERSEVRRLVFKPIDDDK